MAARNRPRKAAMSSARSATPSPSPPSPPQLTRARHRTRLEELAARGVITIGRKQAGERLAKDYAWSGEQLGHLVAR